LKNPSIKCLMKNKTISRRSFFGSSAILAGMGLVLPGNLMADNSKTSTNASINKKNSNLRYKIGICDWMILKRQKIGAFEKTSEIGADGVELDMGGLGDRPTFDNKILDPVFRKKLRDELKKYNIDSI